MVIAPGFPQLSGGHPCAGGESHPGAVYGKNRFAFEKTGVPAGITIRVFVRDCLDSVSIQNGFIEISNLSAGDYDLLLKETGRRIILRLTSGELREGWALSPYRQLEVRNPNQLQITGTEVGNDSINIRLANATEFTRVHIVATRFLPLYPLATSLQQPSSENPRLILRPRPRNRQ